jgi:hypothetical protein
MPLDLAPPPIWLPPKPAIIRPAAEPVRAFIPGLTVPFVAKVPPATVSYRATAGDAGNNSTYTFSSVDIGSAASNRYIVAAVLNSSAGASNLTSATIAGVSATILKAAYGGGSSDIAATLIGASVASGTTGTISVTFSTGQVRCAIGVWAVYGLQSTTPVATASSIVNPASFSIATQSGGIVIAAGNSGDSAGTASWTGVTERFDYATEFQSQSGGDYSATGASLSIGLTWTSAPYGNPTVAVSLR